MSLSNRRSTRGRHAACCNPTTRLTDMSQRACHSPSKRVVTCLRTGDVRRGNSSSTFKHILLKHKIFIYRFARPCLALAHATQGKFYL